MAVPLDISSPAPLVKSAPSLVRLRVDSRSWLVKQLLSFLSLVLPVSWMMWTFFLPTRQLCALLFFFFSGNQLWIISSWPDGLKQLHHWIPQGNKTCISGVCQVKHHCCYCSYLGFRNSQHLSCTISAADLNDNSDNADWWEDIY